MRMDPLAMEILLGCWWVGGFRLLVISIRCHDDGNVWLFLELRWRGGRLDTEGSVSTVWVETVLPASLASSAMSWIRTMGKWSMGRSIIDYWLVSCPHYYANLFPSLHFCPLSNPQGGMERKGAAKAPSFPPTNLYLNSPEHPWAPLHFSGKSGSGTKARAECKKERHSHHFESASGKKGSGAY